ncbi:MAG: NADP-dependent oxidoreductase [Micrococcus sp.]|nr:NADP-dependent oxidoreductase [Micrococcus sp.]
MRMLGFQRYGGPEVMEHLEVADPVPGPGQVLVRMTAAGVNPADIKVRNGQRAGRIPVHFPMALGREAAGVVLGAGPGVTGVRAGERVFGATAAGTGALVDRVLLDAAGTARIPDGVEDDQACCIPVAAGTAHDALDELDLPAGATVLVRGAGGGVGSCVCGLARDRGLRVLGVASEAKRDLVAGLGAVHVAKGPGWTRRAGELAPGGVDAVIDAVGGEVLAEAIPLLRRPGALRSVADVPGAVALGGSGVTRRRTSAVFTEVAALVATGRFTPVVTARFRLAEAERAVAAVETGHAAGNIVVLA